MPEIKIPRSTYQNYRVTGRLVIKWVLVIFEIASSRYYHGVLVEVCSRPVVQRKRTHIHQVHGDILAVGIQRNLQAKSWLVLVNGGSLNQDGEVEKTLTRMDGVHHGTQLEQYTTVNRQPTAVAEGGSDVIMWSKFHYETRSGVLYSLQQSDRRLQ